LPLCLGLRGDQWLIDELYFTDEETDTIKFSGRVLQYIGRVLRPAPGKKKARVYDYVDVKVEVLKAAARSRQKVYAPESHFFSNGGEIAHLIP